ncbi:MAG: endonuclease III [Methanomicrobiaceae archaeon]|nr:endonuclease III [Methanomicrobiaceae archaeon]
MKREDACAIYRALATEYAAGKEPRPFIHFENPFQSLILTILSAQTTDRAVNEIKETLFSRYPTPEALASAERQDLERILRRIGLYRTKAKNITSAAAAVAEEFGGRVPSTMEELLTIPGVGRKTANIVQNHAFGIHEGIAVDTHVTRVSRRLGLTDHTDADRIERDLMAIFPHECWKMINYLFILHGRSICKARNPACERCIIRARCRYFRETRGA